MAELFGPEWPGLEGAVIRIAVVLGACCALSVTGSRAGQGTPPAAPKPLVPVAANSIAASPDTFYGVNVTVTAAVDRILSPTSFTVDQNPSRSGVGEILVLTEVLTAAVTLNTYVTIIGEVVRHEGRPAIRATSVITSSMIDIAKHPPPPMTPEEEAFDRAMKKIGPAFNALRQAVAAAGGGTAKADAAVLRDAFAEAERFWRKQGKSDALKWVADANAHARSLEQAVAAGNWGEAQTAAGSLQQACSACHAAYRQRLDDGTYRIRLGNQ
jgi:hypothetical protein